MFCCRYIIVNTPHKGDNKENSSSSKNNNNAVMGAIVTRTTQTTKTSHPTIHPKSLTPFTESGRQQTFLNKYM
jgi:hypothetical protein